MGGCNWSLTGHRGHPVSKFCLAVSRYIVAGLLGLFAVSYHSLVHIPKNTLPCPSDLRSWKLAAAGIAAVRTVGLIAGTHLEEGKKLPRECTKKSEDLCDQASK